jgi:hypothetical protein
MLCKNFEERPSAADVQTTLANLQADYSAPTYMFLPVEGTAPIQRTSLEDLLDDDVEATTALLRGPLLHAAD